MAEETLLERLDRLHRENKHRLILGEIAALPGEEQGTYAIQSRKARALGNLGEYQGALAVLEDLREEGENDPLWWYRRARALFGLERYREARPCFVRALELDPADRDARCFIPLCDTMNNKGRDRTGKENKY